MEKVVIGIGGEKRAGKSTCASLFTSRYGFKELSFAMPLKKACAYGFNISPNYFDDQSLKEKPFANPITIRLYDLMKLTEYLSRYQEITDNMIVNMFDKARNRQITTPRDLMQFVGTELIRTFVDYEFWTKALIKDMQRYDRVVISDVRFSNEREFVRELGGELIRVDRPGSASGDQHASENQLGADNEYSFIVLNNGTIEDLHKNLDDWYVDGEKKRT